MTTELSTVRRKFPDELSCIKFLESFIWGGGPVCPYCKARNISSIKKSNRYHCNTCNTSFSVTVGTIFHKRKCDLQKWFAAIYVLLYVNKETTIRDLANKLEVAKATASLISSRIKNNQHENQTLFFKIIEIIKS